MPNIKADFCLLMTILLLPLLVSADAGFNIQREKAPCHVVFRGVNKVSEYEFFKINTRGESLSREDMHDTARFLLHNNESLPLYYPDARWRRGPLKVIVRERSTGRLLDSISILADGYNQLITFTGLDNKKLQFTTEKTKAEYPYLLFSNSVDVDNDTAKRNKYILLVLSAIGFLTLGFIFFKKKNLSSVQEKTGT